MGYDLHITRKEHWAEETRPGIDISLKEWLDYIEFDPQLQLSDTYRTKVPGNSTESQVAPGYCEWITHSQNARPWFSYSDGNISTKNPEEDTILKMIEISEKLDAMVQGDNGEIHEISKDGELITRQIDYDNNIGDNGKKPWWKFW